MTVDGPFCDSSCLQLASDGVKTQNVVPSREVRRVQTKRQAERQSNERCITSACKIANEGGLELNW